MRSACLILQDTNMRYVITSQSASGGAACIPVRYFFPPVRKHRVRVHPRLNIPYKGASYLSNRDIHTQKPECYFGSPMRFFFFFLPPENWIQGSRIERDERRSPSNPRAVNERIYGEMTDQMQLPLLLTSDRPFIHSKEVGV